MPTELEMVPLASLRPSQRNAKIHTPDQIEQLRASIRRFGFRDPIGVDQHGNIIEGHGRYMAAMAEGMTDVPVIRLTHLTEKEREAYAIAHNQLTLRTGFDVEGLKEELGRLDVEDGDFLSLGLGAEDVHYLGMGGDAPAPVPPSYEAPAPSHEGTPQSGEEWNNLVHDVVKTTLRFADEQQLARFTNCVERLGIIYPDEPRLVGRLLRFARETQAQ